MVVINGMPITDFGSKKPFHSIQIPDETIISPSDTLQPTRTTIDKLSVVFDAEGVTEENKFQVSNLVFDALRSFKIPSYILFRPSAYDARGDGGYNRTIRLSRTCSDLHLKTAGPAFDAILGQDSLQLTTLQARIICH